MLILGLNGGVSGMGHDPAAVLIENGKILSAIEEERFVGIKHAPSVFPLNSIKFVLKENNVKITDIDKFTYYSSPKFFDCIQRADWRKPYTVLGGLRIYRSIKTWLGESIHYHFRISPKIEFVEHHISHASSSFFLSGFDKANIISMDASGERTCTLLGVGNGSEIEVLKRFYIPNSWGYLYSAFTEYLGFKVGDEGTVMALASFGNPNKYDFFKTGVVKLIDSGYKIHPNLNSMTYSEEMVRRCGEPRLFTELTQQHSDIAASLQDALEKTVKHMAEWLYNQTGYKNLCLSGGTALNCKMNGFLLQQDFVDDIFIQPGSNDNGGAMGSAVKVAVDNGFKFDKMRHAYLGSQVSEEEAESVLKVAKVPYERVDDITGIVAEMLSQDKIVGWVQGKSEWGPRALGNRSILASPKNPNMKDTLNHLVKHRLDFRPYCPSMNKEVVNKYLNGKIRDSPFMILSFDVKEEMRSRVPGIVHVDGSARPQFVEKDINPLYHSVIEKFGKITGDEVLINTSFNDKGQPIIRTADQALKMFYGTGMDALVIGNFLVRK